MIVCVCLCQSVWDMRNNSCNYSPIFINFYSTPDRGAEYCGERVCLSVCVFACTRSYFRNYTSDFHQIFVPASYGRGSVLFWRCSVTLCTSGFMDDVTFAHKPKLIDVAEAEVKIYGNARLKRSAHAALSLVINCAQ